MDAPVSVLTVEYLLDKLREELDDPVLPDDGDSEADADADSLWSTNHLLSCINAAQFKVVRQIKAFTDYFTITLVDGQTEYVMPPWFMEARSHARNTTAQRWIPIAGLDQYAPGDHEDYDNPVWWSPKGSVSLDDKTNRIIFADTPTAETDGDIVRFSCYRFPKIVVTDVGSPLELNAPKYEAALIAWAKREAFNKHDSETYDTRARDAAEKDFAIAMADLYPEERIRRRRVSVVAYGGL